MSLVASSNLLGSRAIKLLLAMGDVTIALLSQRPRACKKHNILNNFRILRQHPETIKYFSYHVPFFIQKKEKLGNSFVKKRTKQALFA